jgi:hypothetical protein
MRPLRRHRRFALVALLAFAAQIILSFGHMHDGASPVHASAPAANCLLHQPCSPAEPAEHDHFCALCWALSAAGPLILPQPLVLGLPVACLQESAPIPPARTASGAEISGFQARAPPAQT